ncbi:SM-20-related protein [Halopseudomonas xinjiangensis]|uniref:SM-20-related protein n=1 Tax=Halopseudomonas xinjiangensis TaxID=487184 RepID=A0A1H1L7W8_9GAMM|nr:2OG-Fe(II) oxygenase [Halopseudomonas xinjiangensis]SDR70628.1 SM-20-related protein [Halopseudomonas xinjiangensis]
MSEFLVVEDRFVHVADDLASRGWSVQPGALPMELVAQLGRYCRTLWHNDDLTPAAIGRGSDQAVVPEIRGDYTRWLDECPANDASREYLQIMNQLRESLNRSLFLGLDNFETHFALYPPGAGYNKHLDRFQDSPLRAVSVVAYLNENWQQGDGGELRLHLDHSTIDVPPRAGTLVVFLSARIVHEVLAANKERASLVGWFRRRPDNPLFR